MIVTLQIQLDPVDPVANISAAPFTSEQLVQIHALMYELCSKLEPLSYVRAGMYVDDKFYQGEGTSA